MEFSENIQKVLFIIITLSVAAILIRHLSMDTGESEVSKYLKANYIKIFSIITIFIFLIMIFSVLGIDFSKSDETTLVDQYVVENFKSDSNYLPESFGEPKEKDFVKQ